MGKYAPFARLGHGGMADVFLAVARGPVGFNKLAVVKRLRNPGDSAHVEMFLDEARLSARLSHPNIVNVYEVGEAQGQYFIAMEYLEGQPLQALMTKLVSDGKGLDEALAAFVAMQALKGLHYAHELTDYDGTPLHVVHRDFSPQNLFITYQGEVKLLDFGIAKAALNSTHTETGVLKGKVRYMAPEQIAERNVDRRADVFAAGIVLWEMLARRTLYQGDSISVLTRIGTEDAPSVRSVRPEIAHELDMICIKALRRDPAVRYPTADAMRADLEEYLRGKLDGADANLARLLNEAFAETRDGVRARIKKFLAIVSTREGGSGSMPNLAQAAELLPALFDGSGSDPSGRASAGKSTTDAAVLGSSSPSITTPPTAPKKMGVIWIAAAIAVLGIGALAVRGRSNAAPPPAPPPAAPQVVATARVHFETTPAGALVERDGQPIARTPADLTLEPGPQTLMLTMDGYETQKITLEIRPGMDLDRTIRMTPKPGVPPPVSAPPAPIARPAAQSRARTPATPAPAASPPPSASATAARPKIRVLDDTDTP